MATRITTECDAPRKTPRQPRSRVTVEAILDAAARILGERGWAGFTTNAAAEVAGVSIGSLYQYFPNKLALVEAVRRRHFEEVLAALRLEVLEGLRALPRHLVRPRGGERVVDVGDGDDAHRREGEPRNRTQRMTLMTPSTGITAPVM